MYSHISLPTTNINLIRNTHDWPWIFNNKFGEFPDRHGKHFEVTDNNARIVFDEPRDIPNDVAERIRDFFEDENSFYVTGFTNVVILSIDHEGILEKIKNYIKKDPSIKVMYVGRGHEQHIYLYGRELTEAEKQKVKELIASFIVIV